MICSAATRAADAEDLIQAGARELYCGLCEPGAAARSRGASRRPHPAQNLSGPEELAALQVTASKRGVPVALLLNMSYPEARLAAVLGTAEVALGMGIDRFVVKDLGLASELRRRFPQARLHASSRLDVATSTVVRLLSGMGFERVILPRHLDLRRVGDLGLGPLGAEVLFYRERCVFDDGHCNFDHNLANPSSTLARAISGAAARVLPRSIQFPLHRAWHDIAPPPIGCLQRFRALSPGPEAAALVRALRGHQHLWACAACTLPTLSAGGIRYLKVMNRTLPAAFQVEAVRFARRILDLYESAPDLATFASSCRSDFRQTHRVARCEGYCYYPPSVCGT